MKKIVTNLICSGSKRHFFLLLFFVSFCSNIHSQIVVNSLIELLPYLEKSNVKVKLKPGIYTITAKDIQKGNFPATSGEKNIANVLFLFSGNNSEYDFTKVTVNVKTEVLNAFTTPKGELYEVQVIGNNNVIKNLKLVDDGSVHDAPKRRATNIVMDGKSNRIEGFHITTRGSYPYGYGEAFGKGGKNVISHRKHSAFLVRGYKNHAKNDTIIHQSYGHAIFMQAADWPTIEGCYVQGAMRSTHEMWKEEGKGTDADRIGFVTAFGYKLPKGYMMCLGEEGIRAYNGGETIIDGVGYKRGTSNPTVLNCTVKNMRAGVTLTHATGKKYVSGTTAIGCERGFCIGTGDIVNCFADTQHGPALGVDYPTDKGMTAEITLLSYEGKSYNGSGHAAIIIGSHHKITFHNAVKNADQNLKINIGGDNKTIGMLAKDENYAASNIVIENFTNYPIVLDDNSKNCSGTSVGIVVDNGVKNNIVKK
ncbi:hypothetical protein [Flavobacterium fluviatile]|uniref:hypothetical protein n=1 Tax=Flavobacterium fluviatile TaxID=1862387 RepID=UPI0013D491E6|nr:hypothetical protein [Flavobacterium fluviatile]